MEPAALGAFIETIVRLATQAIQRIESSRGVGLLLLLVVNAARVFREPIDRSGIDTLVASLKDGNPGSSCAPS